MSWLKGEKDISIEDIQFLYKKVDKKDDRLRAFFKEYIEQEQEK